MGLLTSLSTSFTSYSKPSNLVDPLEQTPIKTQLSQRSFEAIILSALLVLIYVFLAVPLVILSCHNCFQSYNVDGIDQISGSCVKELNRFFIQDLSSLSKT